ncbi:MGDG synthase family glycosyltransferase [Streptomyces sp. RKAG337]|uniref:MGDG synthase family glycosyltransferase n=1 Tax=Streptomyces sp. RKAG337 TaxID=2893404 RepID=UPI00203400F6|nr:UDP-N-acetylglucosamine--N-acetylglucosamine transferase [Streptomyces sp. RKAG337]MCM2425190.1 UDP-N-acetylglucosamine--N-acetylglucosamine transferase [Streptomyces sp. RKAG337]
MAARRIVIISASVGAGHDGAADQLARRLRSDGFHVDRHDFLDLLPAGLGKLLSGGYHQLLTWAPDSYQRIYAVTERTGRPGPAVRALLRSAERNMLGTVTPDTVAVVSTYPGASQVLGALRAGGRLTVPVLTYLTDFSVHALWIAPGVDRHLAAHPIPAGQARVQGASGVTVTGPVVDPRFAPASAQQRQAAREQFALPRHAPLALLVAGSWGVGAVEQAAADIHDSGVAVPVVVCGRNSALVGRLRAQGIEHTYGWVPDIPTLMRACDALVENAGGLTSLEAFASGLPVTSYRCIPGHGQTNAQALQDAGLATWVREPSRLAAVLAELIDGPAGREQRARGLALFRTDRGPAEAVADAAGRPSDTWTSPPRASRSLLPRGRDRRRIPALAVAAAMAGTVALGIGAPLAEAYGDSPAHFRPFSHVLEGDR